MKPTRNVDLTHIIDEASVGHLQWLVILLGLALISVDGFDLQAMGLAAPKIAEEWHLPFSSFGPIFSSSLIGLMAGAFGFGSAGDRLGRKWVLLAAMTTVAVFTLLTAIAGTTTELLIYRFLTGVGLGGTIPTATSMMSEYSPRRLRATLITVGSLGFPIGSTVGGLASGYLVAAYGWPAIFYLAGGLAAVITVLIAAFMPESARFLASRSPENPRIGGILEKVDATYSYSPGDRFILSETVTGSVSIKELFTKGRRAGTALLWTIFFFSPLSVYFILNWLPILFRQTGLPIDKALYASSLFAGGGILGAMVLGWLMDRSARRGSASRAPFAVSYLLAGVFIVAAGWYSTSVVAIIVLITLTGVFLNGCATTLYAVTSAFYPTTIRATGIGWGLGFGRSGAALGPFIGGTLLSLGVSMGTLFSIIGIPMLICAIAMGLLGREQTKQNQPLATSPPQPNQSQPAVQPT